MRCEQIQSAITPKVSRVGFQVTMRAVCTWDRKYLPPGLSVHEAFVLRRFIARVAQDAATQTRARCENLGRFCLVSHARMTKCVVLSLVARRTRSATRILRETRLNHINSHRDHFGRK